MTQEKEKTPWLDAAEIKSRVSIKDILDHYGLTDGLEQKGPQLSGPSPFHKDQSSRLSVNLERHVWNDSAGRDGRAGNVIGLIQRIENCSFREALMILNSKFVQPARDGVADTLREEAASGAEEENTPFGKELGGLRYDVPLLKEKGLKEETLKLFGVGYCSRGLFKGRVVFPVRSAAGEIMAYAGLTVKEGGEPKYRFPNGFARSRELFNIDRIADDARTKKAVKDFGIILVKGFTDVLKLHQESFVNVVALMGGELSGQQKSVLLDPDLNPTRRLTLFLDNTEQDRAAARKIAGELIRDGFVRVADYAQLKSASPQSPAQCGKEELKAVLGFAPV